MQKREDTDFLERMLFGWAETYGSLLLWVMREKVRARERYLNDERLKIAGAERKGRAEGEAKGEAKGRAAEKMETAVNMKQEGFDMAVIAKITGLPLSEIERLG